MCKLTVRTQRSTVTSRIITPLLLSIFAFDTPDIVHQRTIDLVPLRQVWDHFIEVRVQTLSL